MTSFHQRLKVAVIYGGRTGEHEVSLISATSVIRHLDRQRYEIIPIGIARSGEWYVNHLSEIDPLQEKKLEIQAPGAVLFDFRQLCDRSVVELVFPVLHGPYGEDGTVQGLLALFNVAYVGAGVLASAVGMDKIFSKRLAEQAGIPIVPYLEFSFADWENNREAVLTEIQKKFEYPVFVKPANTGSSVAVNKVKEKAKLISAIEEALHYDTRILVEQGLNVREIEVAVLENAENEKAPLVSLPGEIVTTHEFYTYEAKYLDENSLTITIPAVLSENKKEEFQKLAIKIFSTLQVEGMARVDFFMENNTNKIIFNEINTIPGFTHVSMYPLAWQASGLGYSALLDRLIELALKRHGRKQALKLDYTPHA